MSIGNRIKARRKELGLSADELAKRLGKYRSTVYRYESGEIENLPLDILEPIAEALETTPAHLMGWEDEQKKNDDLSDIILKMRSDDDFLSVVKLLYRVDAEKLNGVRQMLTAFLK